MNQEALLVMTTTARDDEARAIARGIVEKKLAACVNIIGPLVSVYEWEGKVVEDTEFKLFIKTKAAAKDSVFAYIQSNHSYSVPEVSVIEYKEMSPEYLEWLCNVVL